MDKILIVARTEFGNAVRTKAFLVSLLMLPILYSAMIFMQIFANRSDTVPRPFAVIDRTGKLFPAIKKAAEERNKSLVTPEGKPTASAFYPTEVKDGDQPPDATVLALSEKVRAKELFAFVEIPADAIEARAGAPIVLKYYSESPNYRELHGWLEGVVSPIARSQRYKAANVDPNLAARIDRFLITENLGLASRGSAPSQVATTPGTSPPPNSGSIVAAKKIDPVRSIFMPMGLAMIVYLITMTTAPQLVGTVIEEKMSRISEMLLGSISTFEMMMGKLLGNVSVAMLTTTLYLAASYAGATRFGYADALTPGLIATLVLFIGLAILLFGSLYMAVGSACSELKDAQTMMMPIMMLAILPMGLLAPVLTNPSSTVSVVASLIPPATPILMTLRIAMSPAPPAWQVILSIVLTTTTAVACVWASGKIFRTGLLMHGKAPTFRELARWVLAR
ncbi:MAG: hypothetical protein JWN86_3719 [Planctomycetota bacterium]|nr:hypothetical protein [Planctomycetota bacterium]